MQEQWKWVEGYEGQYQISNLGNVKSFRRDKEKGRIMKKVMLNCNTKRDKSYTYHVAMFTINNKTQSHLVHRLVAKAFIPNPDPEQYTDVDHINFDSLDNRVENLQWITTGANCRRSFGKTYKVTNIRTGEQTVYNSQRMLAEGIGYSRSAVANWFDNKENHIVFNKRGYDIEMTRNPSPDPGFK